MTVEQRCGTCRHLGKKQRDGAYMCCAPMPDCPHLDWVGSFKVHRTDGTNCEAWEATDERM